MNPSKKAQTRKSEMFALIDQQLQSGLSQIKFCKKQQISIATFSYWRHQYLDAKNKISQASSNQFIPLEIKKLPQKKHPIEIQLPNKIILRSQNWQTEQLSTLILELQKVEFPC